MVNAGPYSYTAQSKNKERDDIKDEDLKRELKEGAVLISYSSSDWYDSTTNSKPEIPNVRTQITHVSEAAMAAIGEASRVVTIAV